MRGEARAAIAAALGAAVREARPVPGGDVNEAYRVALEDGGSVFVKTRARAPRGFFAAEADGLALLRGTGAIRVPTVLALGDGDVPFLALEWIEPGRRAMGFDEDFGRALAGMHAATRPSFGHSRDNYLGPLAQPNAPCGTWPVFYRERRLVPMIAHARRGLDGEALRALDALLPRVETLAATDEPPRVLHGDLWSGNVMVDERGAPCLVDPAAYAGHREVDLAMLALFGSPSPRFFAAYEEALPREPGHDARVPLYQLYFLLAHVALFGVGYLAGVKRALGELR